MQRPQSWSYLNRCITVIWGSGHIIKLDMGPAFPFFLFVVTVLYTCKDRDQGLPPLPFGSVGFFFFFSATCTAEASSSRRNGKAPFLLHRQVCRVFSGYLTSVLLPEDNISLPIQCWAATGGRKEQNQSRWDWFQALSWLQCHCSMTRWGTNPCFSLKPRQLEICYWKLNVIGKCVFRSLGYRLDSKAQLDICLLNLAMSNSTITEGSHQYHTSHTCDLNLQGLSSSMSELLLPKSSSF